MAEIEIPDTHFGRSNSRVVPADALLRLEVRVPARVLQWLARRSNDSGASMSRLVSADLQRIMDSVNSAEEGSTK